MKLIYSILMLLLLTMVGALGVYFLVRAFNGDESTWCASGHTRALGCNTTFGMGSTILIGLLCLVVGYGIRLGSAVVDEYRIRRAKKKL